MCFLNSSFYEPFEVDPLIFAGRATTCLLIDEKFPTGGIRKKYATAFFIDECHLITAGHNVLVEPGGSQEIKMTNAGSHVLDLKLANTQHCTLLENLLVSDKVKSRCDIAILKVAGHNARAFLRPVWDAPLSKDNVVDIVGYPGDLKETWWEKYHTGVKDVREGWAAARKMLPLKTLTVTRGSVKRIGKGIIYSKISTCTGMSGGPLLSNGYSYGCLP